MAANNHRNYTGTSNTQAPAPTSRLDDAVAPGSPYVDLISSFSANDRDFSLDDRFSRQPAQPTRDQDGGEDDARHHHHSALSPRLRNKLSGINPFRSSASMSSLSDTASGSNNHGPPTRTTPPPSGSNGLYSNPFESRTPSPAPPSPPATKSILKNKQHTHQQHRPPNPYVNHPNPPYTPDYAPQASARGYAQSHHQPMDLTPLQPPAPIPILQQTTLSKVSSQQSYYESTKSSSENRSMRNLGAATDAAYNLTQNDMTLEGLTERWNAYQAMMAKYYRDVPFYRRWTRSKWILVLTVVLVLAYSIAGLLISIGFLTQRIEHSALILEFHSNLVYLCLAGSVVGIATGIIGAIGVWRENRVWLSVYNLLLWVVFVLFTAIGYAAFLRAKDFLRSNVRDEWIHQYTRHQRLLVQRELKCCGYQNSRSAAEYDLRCFPGTVLFGCEHKYNLYEKATLKDFWMTSFALVPVELFVIFAALLCSNHVDGMYRSGRPGLVSFKEAKSKRQ